MDWSLALQIAGFALGLLYLWWEFRADARMWIVGFVMSVTHGVLYYLAGLYADAATNLYEVLIGIYGFCVWRGWLKKRDKKIYEIAHTPLRLIAPLILAFVAISAVITWLLITYTDSTVPVMDATTTAAGFVAAWMLSRKYVEHWLFWVVVNGVDCGLCVYKGIPLTGLLSAFYAIMSIAGYIRWLRLATGLSDRR